MRYVTERYIEYQREMTYRIYVTDSLQLQPQNRYKTQRWVDFLKPHEVDKRSGDEIATDVFEKAGLRFNDECI